MRRPRCLAVDLTLHLPAGVTVAADAVSGEVAAGALHLVDAAALAGARYLPATAASPASVRLILADPSGFTVGALGTLTCTATSGTIPSATSFSLDGFSARDANGVALAGIAPQLALRAQ